MLVSLTCPGGVAAPCRPPAILVLPPEISPKDALDASNLPEIPPAEGSTRFFRAGDRTTGVLISSADVDASDDLATDGSDSIDPARFPTTPFDVPLFLLGGGILIFGRVY
jgi:hypothetical protein